MIARHNPFAFLNSDSLIKAKKTANRFLAGSLLTSMLFTMSGCGRNATDVLTPMNFEYNPPDNSVVFDIDDESYYVDEDRDVKFKDKAFKKYFSEEELTYYDLPLQSYLSLENPDSLDELQLLYNINTLDISGCDLEDLSAVGKLSKLKSLYLSNCDNVEDLSFLYDLDIEELGLASMSGIKDLSFVENLTSLKKLSISNCDGCEIDFDAISKLNLNSLDISFMKVEDLNFLENMDNIEFLSISDSNLKDINGIKNLKSLNYINLSNCLITDASILYELSNLDKIDISNNSIDSFDITKFPKLKEIFISGNYSLYTEELLDYCEKHNISIDVTREEVDSMREIRFIVNELKLDDLSESQKVEKIYSYVLNNMEYDKSGMDVPYLVAEYNNDSLYYALQGFGICDTYADFFDAMCDVAGINAYHIFGYGKGGLFNLSGGSHAWNLVEIDGKYMLCDPTWSDSLRDSIKDKNANLVDEDKYFKVYGDEAVEFVNEHMENAYNRDDKYVTPRTDEVITIETTEENGNIISGKVLAGIITGSVCLLGSGAAAICVNAAKKRKRRQKRQLRESEVSKINSSDSYARHH